MFVLTLVATRQSSPIPYAEEHLAVPRHCLYPVRLVVSKEECGQKENKKENKKLGLFNLLNQFAGNRVREISVCVDVGQGNRSLKLRGGRQYWTARYCVRALHTVVQRSWSGCHR